MAKSVHTKPSKTSRLPKAKAKDKARTKAPTKTGAKPTKKRPGKVQPKFDQRTKRYDLNQPANVGWRELVLDIITRRIGQKRFSAAEVLAYKQDLKRLYPKSKTPDHTIYAHLDALVQNGTIAPDKKAGAGHYIWLGRLPSKKGAHAKASPVITSAAALISQLTNIGVKPAPEASPSATTSAPPAPAKPAVKRKTKPRLTHEMSWKNFNHHQQLVFKIRARLFGEEQLGKNKKRTEEIWQQYLKEAPMGTGKLNRGDMAALFSREYTPPRPWTYPQAKPEIPASSAPDSNKNG